MNKFNLFLENHGTKIVLVLLMLTYMKSCSIDSEVSKLKKEAKANQEIINALPTAKQLQIEGLKAEKRMIQATDRKLIDVRRQTEIEEEIKKLKSQK
jgi:Fe2+ transport system protein B